MEAIVTPAYSLKAVPIRTGAFGTLLGSEKSVVAHECRALYAARQLAILQL